MATVDLPEIVPPHRSDGTAPGQARLVEYYSSMGQWCNSAYEEGIAGQQDIPELREMSAALDYLNGLQWKEQMPTFRAKPVSNEILAMFWETVGLLTDVKPMFQISDVGSAEAYSKTQSILNKLGRGWASQRRFERTLAFSTMFAMMTSSPAKIYWDPFARGTSGDPSDGDIRFESLPAAALLRLGIDDLTDLQGDECVIYRRTRSIDWIRRAFPRMGVLVKPEEHRSKYTVDTHAPVTVTPQLFQERSPAAKRLLGISDKNQIESLYPKAEVREFWRNDDSVNTSPNRIWMGPEKAAWGYVVDPGKKLYPRGRLLIQANGVILWDEPNPYWHRRKPFSLNALYSVPWQQYAMSVMSPWMKQQDVLNQILAGVLQNVKRATSPALMAPSNSLSPEAMRAIDSSKPNLKIIYKALGQAPTWQQPPNLPGYVFQTYGTVLQSMKQSSGAAAMDAAGGKKQVPGADTLDRLTFSKNTPIRMMGRNIEDFVNDIGQMWTADCLQFYDAAQRMELLGDQGLTKEDTEIVAGSLIPEGINSESFVRRWRFKCDKGTLLNVQRQDKIQIAFALRKNHDISRDQLFDILDWNINREENKAQLQEEAEAVAKAMAASGIKPGAHPHK